MNIEMVYNKKLEVINYNTNYTYIHIHYEHACKVNTQKAICMHVYIPSMILFNVTPFENFSCISFWTDAGKGRL